MRGWPDCPRCAGTGNGEGGRGCGYWPASQAAPESLEKPPALPPCPYGSDEKHERGRVLKEMYWDTPWEEYETVYMRGVRAVLSTGGIGDYAVYLGAGSAEWVRDHGAKLTFEQAKGLFPRLEGRRYRH